MDDHEFKPDVLGLIAGLDSRLTTVEGHVQAELRARKRMEETLDRQGDLLHRILDGQQDMLAELRELNEDRIAPPR